MTDMQFVDQRPDDEVVIRCNCGGDHFLTLSRYAEPLDGQWGDISVVAGYRPHGSFWSRLGMALSIVRGGCPWTGSAGLTPNDLATVRDWCDRTIRWASPRRFYTFPADLPRAEGQRDDDGWVRGDEFSNGPDGPGHEWTHGEDAVWVPAGLERAITLDAVEHTQTVANGVIDDLRGFMNDDEDRRVEAEERVAALETALREWEAKYGWWDEYDTVRTCGICNEDGTHSDVCPMALLEARPQESRPTPSAEPPSGSETAVCEACSKPEPLRDADRYGAWTVEEHWLGAMGDRSGHPFQARPTPVSEPVEAGVELPDEPVWDARTALYRFVDRYQPDDATKAEYMRLCALYQRAIASQAAAEERSKWERRVDQATRAAEHQFLELREAREEIARLRSKLEEAAGRFMGLASAMHYDTPLQAALIARAIETGVVLREHWRDYIERVCGEKETVANVVAATRRALEASASTEAK